ncbi:hypothetical protein Z949_145 [Sulfitobacter guttiformis KCTC 32187]|uniref:Uncharacterized protein n=1 Tax=Sulfitobacter guttiformis TaxID=74349 RepID=J7G525_9RHOB|nr:hypothetical protein [Sulfitobacter guttiformis]AFP55471.1 hypothetical protein pSD118_069 [Sulfitobacter guttiformis]KIN75515.1 hypothetical protein Z949_145 [Sulfitobacter guttiformis KCTC 32187]RKE92093.1 hypothetical protein C8N30_3850 [Sulfitobacter guttiformis]
MSLNPNIYMVTKPEKHIFNPSDFITYSTPRFYVPDATGPDVISIIGPRMYVRPTHFCGQSPLEREKWVCFTNVDAVFVEPTNYASLKE